MVAQDVVGGAGAVAVWQVEVVAWVAWMRAAGRAEGTIRNRSLYARRLARWLGPRGVGPWQARTDDLAGWLAEHRWGPETRHNAVAAVRGFYDWGVRTGRVARSPAVDLGAVSVPPGLPRPVPEQVLAAALAGADPRTRLMLDLAATAGLRRAEIAAVRGIDVEHDGEGPVLRVMGKGGVERLVPIGERMARRLTAGGYGWVFPTADGEGHLSAGHVGRLMSAVLPPPWTPHALRHRFASRAYAGERDLRAVQELLGHASVSTTQRYTAVPGTAKRRAAGYAT